MEFRRVLFRSRLLIIDDDEMFCHVLNRAMSRRGFEVLVAHDGEQALALARQHSPALATLDLKLEQDSGLKLLPELMEAVPRSEERRVGKEWRREPALAP